MGFSKEKVLEYVKKYLQDNSTTKMNDFIKDWPKEKKEEAIEVANEALISIKENKLEGVYNQEQFNEYKEALEKLNKALLGGIDSEEKLDEIVGLINEVQKKHSSDTIKNRYNVRNEMLHIYETTEGIDGISKNFFTKEECIPNEIAENILVNLAPFIGNQTLVSKYPLQANIIDSMGDLLLDDESKSHMIDEVYDSKKYKVTMENIRFGTNKIDFSKANNLGNSPQPAQSVPMQQPAQPAPKQQPAQTTPNPQPAQSVPMQQPTQTTPNPQPAQPAPKQQPAQTTPNSQPTQPAPKQQPAQTTPNPQPANNIGGQNNSTIDVPSDKFRDKYKIIIEKINDIIKNIGKCKNEIEITGENLGEDIQNYRDIIEKHKIMKNNERSWTQLKKVLSQLEYEEYKVHPFYYAKFDKELEKHKVDYSPLTNDNFDKYIEDKVNKYNETIEKINEAYENEAANKEKIETLTKFAYTQHELISSRIITEVHISDKYDYRTQLEEVKGRLKKIDKSKAKQNQNNNSVDVKKIIYEQIANGYINAYKKGIITSFDANNLQDYYRSAIKTLVDKKIVIENNGVYQYENKYGNIEVLEEKDFLKEFMSINDEMLKSKIVDSIKGNKDKKISDVKLNFKKNKRNKLSAEEGLILSAAYSEEGLFTNDNDKYDLHELLRDKFKLDININNNQKKTSNNPSQNNQLDTTTTEEGIVRIISKDNGEVVAELTYNNEPIIKM